MVSAVRFPASQRGFTAAELLITLTVVGILAAVAIPSMTEMLNMQRVRGVSYDLNADLTFARSQAIARGHNVQVSSVGAGTDWNQGWTIIDTTAAPNVQLRVEGQCTGASPPSPCNLASGVAFTADVTSVTFDRNGRAGTASFNIVPAAATSNADLKRCVKLDPSGRPRTLTGACP